MAFNSLSEIGNPGFKDKQSKFEVTVEEKIENGKFKIMDESGEKVLEVPKNEDSSKFEEGDTIKVFSPTKKDNETLCVGKGCCIVMGTKKIKVETITLKKMIGKKNDEVIFEKILAKIVYIGQDEEKYSRAGKLLKMRNMKIADEDQTVEVAFWFHGTSMLDDMNMGDVISLKNMKTNSYFINDSNRDIKAPNLSFINGKSLMNKLEEGDIPQNLRDLVVEESGHQTNVKGEFLMMESFHVYTSCGGLEGKCRSKVNSSMNHCKNKMCGKVVEKNMEPNNYVTDLVFMSETDGSRILTGFKSVLEGFEAEGKTAREKLENGLLNKPVLVTTEYNPQDNKDNLVTVVNIV